MTEFLLFMFCQIQVETLAFGPIVFVLNGATNPCCLLTGDGYSFFLF